jgi:hypothetical protein
MHHSTSQKSTTLIIHISQLDCSTLLHRLIARKLHHNRQLLALQGWSQLHSNQNKDKNPDEALSQSIYSIGETAKIFSMDS